MIAVLRSTDMKSDHSVRLHCSYYTQGLWFCLFCWNIDSHLSLKLNDQVRSSSGLQFFRMCQQPVRPTEATTSSLQQRSPQRTHGGLGSAPRLYAEGAPPPHWTRSAGPRGLRTKQAAETGSFHWRWRNAGIYNFCISKARTIQKL